MDLTATPVWEPINSDQATFDILCERPVNPNGSAVVVLQEIFGVTAPIRAIAERITKQGFLVLVPDLYWRLSPHIDLPYTREGVKAAFALLERFDEETACKDIAATVRHAWSMAPDLKGVHLVGFCLGGKLSVRGAADDAVTSAISFYGVGIETIVDVFDRRISPVQMHFAGNDKYVPPDAVANIGRKIASKPFAELYTYADVEHGFFSQARTGHNEAAASLAWKRTLEFMERAEHG